VEGKKKIERQTYVPNYTRETGRTNEMGMLFGQIIFR